MMVDTATAATDAAVSVRGLPDQFLHCRLVGHSWQITGGPAAHQYGTLMVLTCSVCQMERHDVFTYNGRLNARRYVAPAGYKIDVDEPWQRPSRDDFRREWYRRAVPRDIGARITPTIQPEGSN
jgi:hypothetical protein